MGDVAPPGVQQDDFDDMRFEVQRIEKATSEEQLGKLLRRAIINVNPDKADVELSKDEATAKSQLIAAQNVIQENGWNPDTVAEHMMKSAALGFTGPTAERKDERKIEWRLNGTRPERLRGSPTERTRANCNHSGYRSAKERGSGCAEWR